MRKLSYYSLFLIPAIVFLVIACSKDKLRSRPSIKLKGIANRTVDTKQDEVPLVIELTYADKEGDIGGSMFLQKIRLNQRQTATINDTFSVQVPQPVVPRTDGVIELRLVPSNMAHAEFPGNPAEPDSMDLRFALRDRAGNVSDTINVGMVIVQR